MHDTALEIGQAFFQVYLADSEGSTIVDIGSCDVNGSLRTKAPASANYVGVDIEIGPGVDVVCSDEYLLPFDDESVDCVVSTSTFEHSLAFWDTFVEMSRIVKRQGYIYINAPSNGNYHAYPLDCWRFYPDAGIALQKYAERRGLRTKMVESFTSIRKNDIWNDFVAVFVKGEVAPETAIRVYHSIPSYNVRDCNFGRVLRHSPTTQDQNIINRSQTGSLSGSDQKVKAATKTLESQLLTVGFSGNYVPIVLNQKGPTVKAGSAVAGLPTLHIKDGAKDASPEKMTDGFVIVIPEDITKKLPGSKIRVSFLARGAGAVNTHAFLAYSTNGAGNSGWRRFDLGADLGLFGFDYEIPSGSPSKNHYIGVLPNEGGFAGVELAGLILSKPSLCVEIA